MPTGPGVVPPTSVPPNFPDDYANLAAINGDDIITSGESSVDISGISDGVGASIVTFLVAYTGGNGQPEGGATIISESTTVPVTDLGFKDANGDEVGSYSATLPTAGLAPGIYVAESFLEFPNGANTVYEDSGPDARQIVSVETAQTTSTPLELSGTDAELSTDGRDLVYTAINEYNEPENTGDVYERDLQTGAEIDLTATGASPAGTFAVNHAPSIAPDSDGDDLAYPTFTSANGEYSFSTINDFDENPDGGGYNPLPVVTNNSTGDQSVLGGIGANKRDVGAATAVSDDGDVVLSTETYEVQYHATGSSYAYMADPQIYVSYLSPAPSITINPINGTNLIPSNATSATITGNSSAIGQVVEIDFGAAGAVAGTATVSSFGQWSFTFNPTTLAGSMLFIEASVMSAQGTPANASETATIVPTIGPDSFSDIQAASTGAQAGQYLWSDDANWSAGLPINGDPVTLAGSGMDDLATLSLPVLIANGAVTTVEGSQLAVSTLSVDGSSGLVAGDLDGGAHSVIIGSIIGTGALFEAAGANASLLVSAATLPSEFYEASDGGRIILDGLAAGSKFGFAGAGTLALVTPGATIAGLIDSLNPGDVLELPGTAVLGASFGAHAAAITTSSGMYDFTNISFGAAIGGISAGLDPATGLEAITFSAAPISAGPDVFQESSEYDGAQPLDGVYFWSDGGNWAAGNPPSDGDSVVMNVQDGLDNLDALSLSSLTLGAASTLELIGERLTIGELTGGGILIAQGGIVASDVTITVDADTVTGGTPPIYGADGPGAVLIDSALFNSGILFADGGGLLELTGTPGDAQLNYSAAFLGYYNGPSTIAFLQPGATVSAPLDFVARQDVLELPGSAVSFVTFGTASLTISTNEGTTTFTNVDFAGSLTGYTDSFDSVTGLEAVTFTGPPGLDVFDGAVVHSDYPILTGELWSTDENWEDKVPRNGDAVEIEYSGTGYRNDESLDDLDNLSLSSLQVFASAALLIAAPLDVGSLTIAAGANVGDQSVLTVDGSTVNDGQLGTDPTTISFQGAVTGDGTISISAGSDVIFYGSVAASQTITFLGSTGTLTLADPSQFNGQIIGSGVEDAVCYLRGTRIATPHGAANIEDLEIGDLVITRLGGQQAIKWIGRQSFDARFIRQNSDQVPVRIAAGALGHGLPLRDLYVSPGHSMLLGGRLILARNLINGVTITQREIPEQVHYYQLEFDAHDCVLAEGAWSESYADCAGMRGRFHNAAQFTQRYPHHIAPPEPLLCAWRPDRGPGLERALRPIIAQAQARVRPGRLRGCIDVIEDGKCAKGWAQDVDHPELPVLLYVFLGGEIIGTVLACDPRHDLREAGIGNGQCSFAFQLPMPLGGAALSRLAVCRAGDGARLLMSQECRAAMVAPVTIRAA